jgi:hypothetical protein
MDSIRALVRSGALAGDVVQYRAGGGRKGTDRLVTIAATLKLDNARKEAKKINP